MTPEVLWPPNHKMVDIQYTVTVNDDFDDNPTWELVEIVSTELDNGLGDGDTADDIQNVEPGTMDTNVSLRAERGGVGTGRVYQATFQATDIFGRHQIRANARGPTVQNARMIKAVRKFLLINYLSVSHYYLTETMFHVVT